MRAVPLALHVAVLFVSSVTTAGLAAYAWRRNEHGTRQFLGLMVVFTLYSGGQLVGLLTPTEPLRLLLDRIQWIGTGLVPLFWLLFAMEYTGSARLLTRRRVGLLSAIPVLTVLFVWTNPWHGLMWTYNALESTAGLAVLTQEFGPWFWVYVVYGYGYIVVGTLLLVRLAWLSDQLYLDQSVLLVVGAVAPLLASVSTLLDISLVQNPTLDMTPYAFVVSGVAFGYAIFRHRLFDVVPATRQLGRRSAIQDLEEGVVIVDTNRSVIYCNPAAASLLEVTPDEILGRSVRSVVDSKSIDFDTDDALSKFERSDAVYEVRTSPIRNRRGDLVGHTLLFSDITARKRRERRLKRQRDELRQLEELNSVLRGINRALASATSHEEVERAVCTRLAESGLYRTACIGDVPTWNGDADRWTVTGEDSDPHRLSALVNDGDLRADGDDRTEVCVVAADESGREWTVVPLVYRRTVYGALGVCSDREVLAEPAAHREVLAELGLTIGHAINAVENRQLLSDDPAIELELRSDDEDAPLLHAASTTGCRLELDAIVTDGGMADTAYVNVAGRTDRAATALDGTSGGDSRVVDGLGTDSDGGIIEWTVPEDSLLGILTGHSLNVLGLTADDGRIECRVEVSSEREVRTLIDDLAQAFPETRLEAKRQQDPMGVLDGATDDPGTAADDLTDRQREALEVAYRAGYFEWPRESSAEEVAETLDISRPTFQAHLRKAEDTVLAGLFDADGKS